MDDASDPVASSDPEGLEVGYLGWKRFERSGAGQGHVRSVVVVVTLAGRQDPAEVGQVPDKGAVEKLAAASADPPLHDRVHPGHPDAAAHDPQAGRGEYRVEAQGLQKAWQARDIGALIGLLDPGATVIADGGGLATTFLRPIEGGEQIARAWVEIANRAPSNMTFLERTVNGQPGLVAQQDGITVTVFAFEVAGDQITHIWAVRNPGKLRPWTTG